MLFYFLKIGWRNLKRPSIFSTINFLSFSAALAVTFMIYQYVKQEYTTDTFFKHKEQLVRLVRKVEDANASYRSPSLAAPYLEDFVSIYGVDKNNVTRVFKDDELVTVGDNSFFEAQFFYADPTFFDLLDFPFQYGNAKTALSIPNAVVISQKVAKKYFGSGNPLGKIIEIDNKGLLKVTGVLSPAPSKSHLEIDFLAPLSSLGYAERLLNDKEVHAFSFYMLTDNMTLPTHFEGIEENTVLAYQPFTDVYFDNTLELDEVAHGNKNLLKSLIAIAILILFIAGANFLNLILSTSLSKIKDLGVRKVLGSNWKLEVFRQLVETYLIVLFSFLLATTACFFIAQMMAESNAISFELDTRLLIIVPLLSLLLTLLFALYPSVLTATINASSALEKKVKNLRISYLLESILTFQFAITMLLIVLSVLITKQFNFLQNREIGLNPDQVLYFSSNNRHSFKNLKNIQGEIERLPGVQEVAMSIGGLPDSYTESITYHIEGMENTRQLMTAFTSANFPSLLDMEIIEGKLFDTSLSSDVGKVALVNETAARQLGWPAENILGTTIEPIDYFAYEEGQPKKIIGIVKDFHFDSFKKEIEPSALLSTDLEETVVVKLLSENAGNTVLKIASIWDKYVPKYPFEYNFLDQKFQRMHEEDTRQRSILYLFSTLAIIISMAGLLGLSAYLLQVRRKEIVIRSVLGATSHHLLLLLTSKYIKLLLMAGIISIPISLFLGTAWLNDFSYRIAFSPSIFFMGITLVMVLMLSILGIQIMYSIAVNPAEELGNE